MKRCLVTGAGSGIGAALRQRFLEEGYEVVGVDIAQTPDNPCVVADLTVPGDRERVVERCGTFDVVIHCAGTSAVGEFQHIALAEQMKVVDLNLEAPLQLTARMLRTRAIKNGGSLVFVASLSHYVGYPGASVYAATKDGLAAYARGLSVSLAPRRIHVATAYPGPTRTPHARHFSPDPDDESRRMPPEQVAQAIYRGVTRRRRTIVPGVGNKVIATLGHVAPRAMTQVMRRVIYEPLTNRSPKSPRSRNRRRRSDPHHSP